jgi:glycosyltransferase involved in cell wall biosynthesis
VRSLQILSMLSRRHSVTVLTTHGPADDPDGLARYLSDCSQVISIPYQVPKRGSYRFPLAVVQSWASAFPVDLWKWRLPELRRQLERVLAAGHVDLCVADFLFAAVNVPLGGEVPIVLFEHNVEHLIWKRLADLESNPLKRGLLTLEWTKLRRIERHICEQAGLTIAVSEEDERRLSALAPQGKVASIPTGVDTTYFNPAGRQEIAARLVFSGSMDWHPNEDAVIYFGESILPRIRREVADVSFAVVGRNPTEHLRRVAEQLGMTITGTVDDVRPFLEEAAVYVVPLRAGSGTRMKIFEALAMAKPVVSTTVGAEGLKLTPDEHFVAADDPEAFAAAVVLLLGDDERRRALGAAGRALVVEHYSWDQVARQFEHHCEQMVVPHEEQEDTPERCVDVSRRRLPRPRGTRLVARVDDVDGRPRRHY